MAPGRIGPSRRLAERGATLSLIAFSTCIVLITLGSTYVVASQSLYRLAILRAHLAQAREAAEAGLALAERSFASAAADTNGGESQADGARLTWDIESAGRDRATIRAEGRVGAGRDRVAVRLVADVARVAGKQQPRVFRITREVPMPAAGG